MFCWLKKPIMGTGGGFPKLPGFHWLFPKFVSDLNHCSMSSRISGCMEDPRSTAGSIW